MTFYQSLRSSLVLAFGVGLGVGACQLPNPNHCQNIALDANAWCGAVYSDEPYCSPCEADNNGCVADEPTASECPAYTAPAPDSGTGTESDTDTSTDEGTDDDADAGTDTGATETG
ncbi:hypothetical protein [Enhygromyxa salina]|uniref:Uncharacterized protein n=1 Tax=Enhygromyxa salina TaxID=215803 RepID=A0A2S9YWG7_9BACT|nr:hypothetical protein [Enhygromyxa salina]PRQ09436.1 hypothetical protein ENSA7_08420 [Enhygromyxa salina]